MVEKGFLSPKYDPLIQGLCIAVGFFFWGCLGMIMIIRKEVPQIIMIKGKPAVILGLIFTVSSFGVTLYALYQIMVIYL